MGERAQRILPLFIMAAGASGAPRPLGMAGPGSQLPSFVSPLGEYRAVTEVLPIKKALPLGRRKPGPSSSPYGS